MLFSYLWKTFRIVLIAGMTLLFFRTFIVETGRVNGVSMEPTFIDNNTFFVNKFQLLFSVPFRGQLVQCKSIDGNALLIKRVIGLPGEVIHIRENKVSITDVNGNEILLNETYIKKDAITRMPNGKNTDIPIPENHYFVLGDNRRESIDSRVYGPMPRENIIGSVFSWH